MWKEKKRMLHKVAVAAIIVIIVIVAFTACGSTRKSYIVESYNVRDGDTLWTIAQKYCDDDEDLRRWIADVEKLNAKSNCKIYVGEELKIIVKEQKND